MDDDIRLLLVLLCMLAAWAWVWRVVTTRRIARKKNRFAAHLIGVMLGWGAAAGAFCLSGAFLMPGAVDEPTIAVGVLGALVLLMYLGALHLPRKKEGQNAEASPVTMPAVQAIEAASAPVRAPKPFKESFKAWWQEEKRKQDEYLCQKEVKRAAREKALGMSLGDFFCARLGDHFMCWGIVLFFVVWGWLFFSMASMDLFTRLIVSFAVTGLLAIISCILFLPVFLLSLVLLPFVCVSIFFEARERIRNNNPYFAPPVIVSEIDITPSAPHQSNHDWLVPLVIGLWIGNAWGKDK